MFPKKLTERTLGTIFTLQLEDGAVAFTQTIHCSGLVKAKFV